MASGLVAGCWVFLAGTMPLAKYTNREKSKGGSRCVPLAVTTLRVPRPDDTVLVTPGENIQIATLSQRERRLLPNPFDRHSMGIDIQIYLTEVPLPPAPPSSPPFSFPLIFSFSLFLSVSFSFSLQSSRSPRDENRYT